MKVTLLQRDIVWANPHENTKRIDQTLQGVGETDLIVLPEMFSTGFVTEPEGLAETNPPVSLEWMKATARNHDCAVAGSIAVEDGGHFYNRFYFVRPDGSADHYDKRHLFTYGGEQRHFTPGRQRVVVNWRGVRILLQVCYDLRFPTFSRNQSDYDLALYVASWPTSRLHAWSTLLHARAIENQCFVAGVDRTGDDPACSYSGGTMLIDPYGNTLAEAEYNREDVISADIDMEALRDFRERFPVLNDRDQRHDW